MSLTVPQERALAILPKFTGTLGFLSAVIVLREVVATHRRNRGNPVLRAIAGLSLFYMMDAMSWAFSTWLVPASSGFAYATGSIRTCAFQGFWLQAVIAAPIYTAVMSLYFYLVACHGTTNDALVKIEKYIHAVVLIFTLGTSFAFLGMDLYNPIGSVCWVNGSPPQCGSSTFAGFRLSTEEDADYVPCERGDYAWMYGMLLFYMPLWICILLLLFFNASIFHSLKQQKGGSNSEANWVAQQAFMYFAAFTITWAPSTVWSAMHYNNGGFFVLDLMAAICEPLGGVWILCIFLSNRPTLRKKLLARLTCRAYADNAMVSSSAGSRARGTISKESVEPGQEAPLPAVETKDTVGNNNNSNCV